MTAIETATAWGSTHRRRHSTIAHGRNKEKKMSRKYMEDRIVIQGEIKGLPRKIETSTEYDARLNVASQGVRTGDSHLVLWALPNPTRPGWVRHSDDSLSAVPAGWTEWGRPYWTE